MGNPRQLIVATAEALGVDCLVIGAHSKRSFIDVLLGGTAAAITPPVPSSWSSQGKSARSCRRVRWAKPTRLPPGGISLRESGKPSVDQVAPLATWGRGHYMTPCRCEAV